MSVFFPKTSGLLAFRARGRTACSDPVPSPQLGGATWLLLDRSTSWAGFSHQWDPLALFPLWQGPPIFKMATAVTALHPGPRVTKMTYGLCAVQWTFFSFSFNFTQSVFLKPLRSYVGQYWPLLADTDRTQEWVLPHPENSNTWQRLRSWWKGARKWVQEANRTAAVKFSGRLSPISLGS